MKDPRFIPLVLAGNQPPSAQLRLSLNKEVIGVSSPEASLSPWLSLLGLGACIISQLRNCTRCCSFDGENPSCNYSDFCTP